MKKIALSIALAFITATSFAQTAEEATAINKWIDIYAQLNSSKDWNKMVDQASDCQKEAPSWEYLSYYLGVAYFNLENYQYSINKMMEFIDKTDTVPAAFMIRAGAYAKEKEYDAALEDYNHVLKLRPNDVNALIELANLSLTQGDNRGYIKYLSKVLEVEPANVEALTNRAAIYARDGKFQEAAVDITAAIAVKPTSSLYINRAKINLSMQTNESFVAAIEDCNEAEKLGTATLEICRLRLACNQSIKNYAEMVKDYDKMLGIEEGNVDLVMGRGVAKFQMNDFKGAIADMDIVIAKDPKNIKAYQVRATSKTKIKDTAGAQADAEKVKELQGGK